MKNKIENVLSKYIEGTDCLQVQHGTLGKKWPFYIYF